MRRIVLPILCLGLAFAPLTGIKLDTRPALALASSGMIPSQAASRIPDEHIHFGHLGLDEGLSQSSVTAITQDSQGFMWFGTEDGLNRYDGLKFKIYRPVESDPTSISDIWITALTLDASGNLWVGTRQGGLNRYDAVTGKFTRYQHSDDAPESLSDNNVRHIYSDSQGRLWVATLAGLDLFNPATGDFQHFTPADQTEWAALSIEQDASGIFWIGSNKGLWRFDPAKTAFSVANLGETRNIFDVMADPDGSLWVTGTEMGLTHYFPNTDTFEQYVEGISYSNTRRLWRDPSGQIWVGAAYGLNLFNPATGKFISFTKNPNISTSLSETFIHSLFIDSSGILWVGTYGGGLSIYDPLANKFTHYWNDPENPKSLASSLVFSIVPAPDGTVWLATLGAGMDNFDPRTGEFKHFTASWNEETKDPTGLRSEYINSILLTRDGKIWAGSEGGIDVFDPKTGKFTYLTSDPDNPASLPPLSIQCMIQARDGTIWVGTIDGLLRYNASDHSFTTYSVTHDEKGLNDGFVSVLYEDSAGLIWAGTYSGGISRLDPKTGLFTHFVNDPQVPGTLGYNTILSFYESPSGEMWVGTGGGGLNLFEPATGTFKIYNDTNGLPNNVIYGILPDEAGNLWLSTNFGVARFDPRTGKSQNYTTADGLQSNEFNATSYAMDAEGRMYFGGINGLNVFRPSEVASNGFIPPVSLVSVTENGNRLGVERDAAALEAITIRYPNNSFEFEFASLSFSQSKKNEYAYKLEGYDNDWYFSGKDRAGRYANLPGGEYTLRLKASNADGVWNEEGVSLKVTVIPPFWQTWWFYGLVGLALVAGVFGVYRLRVHDVETQKRELERQVAERTREIEHLFAQTKELAILEERNRLARDLHDSAKQKAFAALAQLGAARSLSNGNMEKATRHLQEAETLVGEVIQEITFLIQEIHPAALKEKGLAPVLREYVFEWGNRTGIDVDLRIEGERRMPLELEQTLYRSIQESLANVARHSGATNARLELNIAPAVVKVSLQDNGQGFDPNSTPTGMGLRSIRERVEAVGGAFEVKSMPGNGTQLEIQIPLEVK